MKKSGHFAPTSGSAGSKGWLPLVVTPVVVFLLAEPWRKKVMWWWERGIQVNNSISPWGATLMTLSNPNRLSEDPCLHIRVRWSFSPSWYLMMGNEILTLEVLRALKPYPVHSNSTDYKEYGMEIKTLYTILRWPRFRIQPLVSSVTWSRSINISRLEYCQLKMGRY